MDKVRKLQRLPDGAVRSLRVERFAEGYRVSGQEPAFQATLWRAPGSAVWSILNERGESFEAVLDRRCGEILVSVGHRRFRFAPANRGPAAERGSVDLASSAEIRSPMPGKIVKLLVSVGDVVAAGQGVVVFEAMKMQNELRSPRDGLVEEVDVRAGQAVEARERLLRIVHSRLG
jgi:biotin carboxyl carrier protein